jgi:hypothetical protein
VLKWTLSALAVLVLAAVTAACGQTSETHGVAGTTATRTQNAQASVVDGRIVLGGKPFFPVMLFEQCDDADVALGRALGINLVVGGGCPDLPASRQLAMIEPRAFAVMPLEGGEPGGRAFVGWSFPDEPENNGWSSERLRQTFGSRRGTPDGLLTFLTTGAGFSSRAYTQPSPPLSEYRALAGLADVPGFDLYPLGHCSRDLGAVYDAQREFVALAGGAPTFQWIETGPIRPEYCGGFAMQPAELRAEVWLAVAGGARGIGYYTHTWSPDHREFDVSTSVQAEMQRTNADLAQSAPGLLGDRVASSADSPAIKLIARTAGDATHVFAVNSGTTHVRAQLRIPSLDDGAVRVLGEKRVLRAGGHAFADDFAPLGVHRYVQGG